MNDDQPGSSTETPAWLKHLQENSWEAEILISGGAIFGLFQLSDAVVSFGQHMKELTDLVGLNLGLLFTMVMLKGITVGFVIHLFLRGFWVALVCLNSVYSKGVDLSRIRLSGKYFDEVKKISVTNLIIRLDALSGLLFFGSFIFTLVMLGAVLLFVIPPSLNTAFFGASTVGKIILNAYVGLIALYILDFLTTGLMRRNNLVGKIYRPVYVVFNAVSLAWIYRPLMQVVSTNVNRWKAGAFIVLLTVTSIFFSFSSLRRTFAVRDIFDQRQYMKVSKGFATDYFYFDRIPPDERVVRAAIQSDIIGDEPLRVFVPYRATYDELIESDKAQRFSDIVSIYVNDTLQRVQWHDYDRVEGKQRGVLAYVPTDHLPKGENRVGIKISNMVYVDKSDRVEIPFWKK